jgi:ribosomal protein L30/L7E
MKEDQAGAVMGGTTDSSSPFTPSSVKRLSVGSRPEAIHGSRRRKVAPSRQITRTRSLIGIPGSSFHSLSSISYQNEQARRSFNFQGKIEGQSKPSDLLQSLQGDFDLEAMKGKFDHQSTIIKVLTALNIREVFSGKIWNRCKRGPLMIPSRCKAISRGANS